MQLTRENTENHREVPAIQVEREREKKALNEA